MSSDLVTANEINSTPQYVASQDGDNSALSISTENVGIGTESPSFPLDIASQSAGSTVFRVKGSSGNSIVTLTEGSSSGAGNLRINASDGTTAITLRASTTGFASWINTGANFGIGTESPSSTLEVDGTFTVTGEVALTGVKPESQAPSGARLEQVYIDPATGILYFHD